MADTSKPQGQQGQADKAAAEVKTAQVAQEQRDQQQQSQQVESQQQSSPQEEARSAAEKLLKVDREESAVNPYPAYDFMTLEQLRSLAEERGVEVNRDVEKAHLITELRAADSGTPSAVTRRGAR